MKRISMMLMAIAMTGVVFAQNIPATLRALHPSDEKVECQFKEERKKASVKETEKREGKIVYQAPDDLRMDYTQPAGDYILITADKMEQCKNGKKQSVRVKNSRSNRYTVYRATLLSCIAGDIENAALLNDAKYRCEQKGNKYLCTITAEDAGDKELKEIQLEYEVGTGKILMMKLTEGSGNTATFHVSY